MHDRAAPVLLFYCQHSLGIGHLTRSFALAETLSDCFRVVFLNGGPLPSGLPVPAGIELIDLPPLGMDDGHTLVRRDGAHDVGAARAQRRALIEHAVAQWRPAVLLVELFPFGRKKFVGEILPMLRQARRQPGGPALVACSLRDILVDARPDQQRHDDRARWLANRYFDAVIVHADPAFARLEDSFHPTRPLRTPVHYSGFVVPDRKPAASHPRGPHVLVSAGGGSVGAPLLRTALEAHEHLRRAGRTVPMRVIAGPFLPGSEWAALRRSARGRVGIVLVRHVPDMVAEMRAARASISQCGYNTALDIVVAGVPALVVPYETAAENEQRQRALRLARLGAVLAMPAGTPDGPRLAERIEDLLAFAPHPASIELGGARRSAHILRELHDRRRSAVRRASTEAPCPTG